MSAKAPTPPPAESPAEWWARNHPGEPRPTSPSPPKGTNNVAEALKAENKILRTCFCIADDETVVSSIEGSILIDKKGGTRRRYFVATEEERKLKEQLDAVTAERDELREHAGLLDTNWSAVHDSAMSAFRAAFGMPGASIPEMLETLAQLRSEVAGWTRLPRTAQRRQGCRELVKRTPA